MRIQTSIACVVLAGAALLASCDLAQQSAGTSRQAAVNAAASPQPEKSKLEIEHLQAQIAKLKAETREIQPWYGPTLGAIVGVVLGFLGVTLTVLVGFRTALKARLNEFDVRLYEKRLEVYGRMVEATSGIALFFPEHVVDQGICAEMGRQLRHEFFSITGTVLTDAARKRYMTLLHALTHAARGERLNVPRNDDDYARGISEEQVGEYRRTLMLTMGPSGEKLDAEAEMKRCREHRFGVPLEPAAEGPAERFKDFVVLQFAASRLRTELGRDVNARRPLTELARAQS